MMIRFGILFLIVLPLTVGTGNAKKLPNAEVIGYIAGEYGKIAQLWTDFGIWNSAHVKDDWYSTVEYYRTIKLKPGLKPEIELSYLNKFQCKWECKEPREWMSGSFTHGSIYYYFRLNKIHPLADYGMTVRIIHKYKIEVTVNAPTEPFCNFKAEANLLLDGKYDSQHHLIVDCHDTKFSKKLTKSFSLTYGTNEIYEINLVARIYQKPYYDTQTGTSTAKVYIDPITIIDPDYKITVNNKEYPANELFAIEFSENLVEGGEKKSLPWLPLILLED